ncbi:interferon-inducible GTPase 5-like [Dermochelys coriacea]|uniref:interferon-inducible GTPase 5-like n=1 Tax=Dermochelys coriacea TaxID=27794 RepID=UPI001CA9CE06|nr:interferon-inducible GTPase 5-like [Dermochelys coriacea]
MEELKAALGKENLIEAVAKPKEALEGAGKFTLNIAVTGEAGSGKSSFVNAIRGLGDEDDGAAETGLQETTEKHTAYPHPTYPNVRVWDLPGTRMKKFELDTYFKRVEFSRFNFFITISSPRVACHDISLAQEIQRQGKKIPVPFWCRGVTAVPLPGLSTVCDVAMLVTSLKRFCSDFSLDEKSLTTLARQANKPIADLKAIRQSPLSEAITQDLVMKLLTKCAAGAVKYSTYLFNFVSVVGSVVPAAVSLPTIKIMLQNFLDDDAADTL